MCLSTGFKATGPFAILERLPVDSTVHVLMIEHDKLRSRKRLQGRDEVVVRGEFELPRPADHLASHHIAGRLATTEFLSEIPSVSLRHR